MSGDPLADIRSVPPPAIEEFFRVLGEKPFRARQVMEWLWKKSCRSFDEMTNLPASTREEMKKKFSFPALKPAAIQESKDGTVKAGFLTVEGNPAEGVLIPSGDRLTACISSQSGCPLACTFCATGQFGFRRNLTAGEIFDQLTLLSSHISQTQFLISHPISHIVFMGMGEPLLNYEQVKGAIEKITSPDGLAISPQRITVSSVGIPEMIRKMADDHPRYHFALSLHTASNEKRNKIVPINKKYPVEMLAEAMKYYYRVTKHRFTIEYILFRNFNDSLEDAKELAGFCRNFPVKINLIEYNEIGDGRCGTGDKKEKNKKGTALMTEKDSFVLQAPGKEKVRVFREVLEGKNLVVNLRKSRGRDIDAACGQLAGRI